MYIKKCLYMYIYIRGVYIEGGYIVASECIYGYIINVEGWIIVIDS